VLHRAFVEVNEEGTAAAAVTAGLMALSSARPKPPRTFEMIVDRPFFFAISHLSTNQILFMGSVEQPDL
jgi:serpin B